MSGGGAPVWDERQRQRGGRTTPRCILDIIVQFIPLPVEVGEFLLLLVKNQRHLLFFFIIILFQIIFIQRMNTLFNPID